MAGQTVIVSVLADTRKFNSAMRGTNTVLKTFENGLRRITTIGTVAFTSLAYATGRFVVESIKAAEEAEAIDRKLVNQARNIGTLGKRYKEVSERLLGVAEAQQKLLGVDDDLIKGVQTLLLTFPKLAKTAKDAGGAFDRTTQAAFNLAELGFGDAISNAKQLGKALEDPIKGITALSRSGITFSKEQKDQIKNWVESGNRAKAYSYILDIIETQSINAGIVGATATQKLATSWDNLQEVFGKKLLPQLTPAIDKVTEFVYELSKSKDFEAFIKEFADSITILIKKLPGIIKTLKDFFKWLNKNNISLLEFAGTAAVVNGALATFGPSLLSWFGSVTGAKAVSNTKILNDRFDVLNTSIASNERALKKAGDQLADWNDKNQKTGGKINTTQSMVNHLTDRYTKLKDESKLLTTEMANLTTAAANAGVVLGDNKKIKNGGFLSGLMTPIKSLKGFFTDIGPKIATAAKAGGRFALALGLILAAVDLFKGVYQGFKDVWDEFAKANPKGAEDLAVAFERVNKIIGWISDALEGLGGYIGNFLAILVIGIAETFNAIWDTAKLITKEVKKWFTQGALPTPSPAPSPTPSVRPGNYTSNGSGGIVINVAALTPTPEVGRVVAAALGDYQRVAGVRV